MDQEPEKNCAGLWKTPMDIACTQTEALKTAGPGLSRERALELGRWTLSLNGVEPAL